VIRSVLVPAMMAVAGEWTWWAPAPLQQLAEYLDIAEKDDIDDFDMSPDDNESGV
jgi:hypothetical protein